MNNKRILALLVAMGILLLGASRVTGQQDEPQSPKGTYGSAFTYQGQLKGPSGPVNGTCDLRFRLFDSAGGGTQVGSTITYEGVELVDGLFTARLDFGGVHEGSARWLEVNVRCPAGNGDYIPLAPLQELTGAPAALSLALPFYAEADIGGPLVSVWNSGGGEAGLFGSDAGAGLSIPSAGTDGLHVGSAGQNGLAVDTAGVNGMHVGTASANGLHISAAGADGVLVSTASGMGLAVDAAGDDGVYVGQAGSPTAVMPSEWPNGVEVAGAEGHGLYVGRADADGVVVSWTGATGVVVVEAENNGVSVLSVGGDGVAVGWAGYDGVYVQNAGNPSAATVSAAKNGFEVAGAEGYGLYVGRADLDGVYVNSTAWHGLNVAGAGVDGLYVSSADSDGVDVTGSAFAGNFHGDINVSGNCIGCALAVFSLNAGDQPLEPGQIVTIQGVEPATLDNAPALWRVVPAGEGTAAVGVVHGKAALDEAPEGATLREGETGRRLVPRSGVAQPGDYLTLVIYGPMQVRVSAADGPVEPGTRLAVGKMGAARALKTVVVEGLTLAESAPTVGIALTAPDEDGLVWVLVNPQ